MTDLISLLFAVGWILGWVRLTAALGRTETWTNR
jgi:uncharacterized membrane protein YciS (DUF1049 family)